MLGIEACSFLNQDCIIFKPWYTWNKIQTPLLGCGLCWPSRVQLSLLRPATCFLLHGFSQFPQYARLSSSQGLCTSSSFYPKHLSSLTLQDFLLPLKTTAPDPYMSQSTTLIMLVLALNCWLASLVALHSILIFWTSVCKPGPSTRFALWKVQIWEDIARV